MPSEFQPVSLECPTYNKQLTIEKRDYIVTFGPTEALFLEKEKRSKSDVLSWRESRNNLFPCDQQPYLYFFR